MEIVQSSRVLLTLCGDNELLAEKELKSHPQTRQGHHQRSFMREQITDPSKKIKDCLFLSSLVVELPWKGHDSESER